MVRPVLVLLLLLTAALPGCLDADPAPQASTDDPEATHFILTGRIMDQGLEPVAHAIIHVHKGNESILETDTDDQGVYQTAPLERATYRLQVLHECCLPVVIPVDLTDPPSPSIDDDPDSDHPLVTQDIQLEPLPSLHPYHEPNQWNGFIACGFDILLTITNDCGDPNHRVRHTTEIQQGLKTLLVAVTWDDVNPLYADELELKVQRDAPLGGWYTYETVTGGSPLELRIDGTGYEQHSFDELEGDESWTLRFQVRPIGTGTFAYQQPFTIYYNKHYWESAPDLLSAVPEE